MIAFNQLDTLSPEDIITGEDDLHPMDSIALSSGAKEQVLSDFNALKEAQTLLGQPKYHERPTLETVAKIICAQSSGPHKDIALFELSHFCLGIQQLIGADQVLDVVLHPEKPTANRFKNLFEETHQTDSIFCDKSGLHIKLDKHEFTIRYGRMTVLCALYDFIASMDNFKYFEEILSTFQNLYEETLSAKSIQACANKLGSILRKYRVSYLTYQEADGKFLQVLKFLQERNAESELSIQDNDILDFWTLHNTGKDYRGYKTVFELFCDFTNSLDQTMALKDAVHAAPLGLDRESGEIDVSDDDVNQVSSHQAWENPFAVFDEPDLSDIRFFKKASERQPMENMMDFGPDALSFPLAFLRYDVFGQVQSGITNDLQVGRGIDSVKSRISGETSLPYSDRISEIEQFESHLKNLQAASLYVISSLDENSEMGQLAKNAFLKLKRKGFDEEADPDAFQQAASALVALSNQTKTYLEKIEPLDLESQFEQDQTTFRLQFERLYADALT